MMASKTAVTMACTARYRKSMVFNESIFKLLCLAGRGSGPNGRYLIHIIIVCATLNSTDRG